MKKFILTSLFFFLGLYFFLLIPDVILTAKVKHTPFNDGSVWGRIVNGEMDYELLIFGSSRAWVHYNPRIIDSVLSVNSYNLGRDGKKLDVSALMYNIYTKHNKKPKALIVDYYFMSMEKSDAYKREQFYPYLLNKDIWNSFHKIHQLNVLDRFFPMAKYYGNLKNTKLYFNENKPTYKGFHGSNLQWDGTTLKTIEHIPFYHDSTVISMTESWFKQCKKDGVKVILVHSPIHNDATKKIDDIVAMRTFYQQLANKYNFPILDYSTDPICFDTNYFYNAQHLNKKGADYFTLKLSRDINSLNIFK